LVDPTGAVTRFDYDDRGHLVAVTDALGGVTRLANDAAGLPMQVTGPDESVTRIERDAFGRVTAVVDANGDRTSQTWTIEGLLASRTLPDGATETWTYDAEGNLVEHVDAAGHATSYTYGAFDKPVSMTAPDGSVTEFVHDTELRLTQVLVGGRAASASERRRDHNDEALRWTYSYDAAGRLSEELDFNGRSLGYHYDEAGQLVRRVNGAGQSVQLSYDLLGRTVSQVDDAGRETRFEYDAAGRLAAADTPDVTVAFERDSAGRVLAETVDGRTLRSSYDLLGRRTSRLTPTGVESAWTYDAAGRALAVDVAGHVTRFERDAAGRERLRQWDSGAALAQLFDETGRVSVQTLTAPRVVEQRALASVVETTRLGTLHERHYRYRPDGALLGVQDSELGSRTFDLDQRGRVTGVHLAGPARGSVVERYAYDGAGNLTESAWAGGVGFSAAGRHHVGTLLQRTRDTRFTYDRHGRLVQRVRTRLSRKPEVWQYDWDVDDRLVGLTTPDGVRWRYMYDALGRRTAKERLAADGSVASRVVFTWDGVTLVEQTGAGGSTSWEYDGLRPLAQLERSADSLDARFFAIVTDLVGAPTELLDESGHVAWRADRNLWGAPADRSRSATPLAFPGQYADSESGLFYNLFRYYDPHTATYISQDPLGLRGGPNPSAYVHNPTTHADPLGLFACDTSSPPRFSVGANGTTHDMSNLDWSIVSKSGETRADHIALHEAPNSNKAHHGVFVGGDSQSLTSEAWSIVRADEISPTRDGTADIYIVDMGRNVGYAGGADAASLAGVPHEHIRILTIGGTNQVITAFPVP
jgi:RHS repeat-associated protein